MSKLKALAWVFAGLLGVPGLAQAQELTELTIMQPTIRSMIVWPIHVGEMLGYFEQEGISLRLISSDGSIPYVLFLSGGSADLAMLGGAEVVHAVNAGFEIANVYSIHQQVPQGIYVADGNPLYSAVELKGRTVGLASDRDHISLKIAMAHAESTIDGVETIVVGEVGPVLVSVFKDGIIDAFVGSTTAVAALAAQGIKARDIAVDPAGGKSANVYAMLKNRIEELRGPMCGFFRAWSKGVYIGQQDIEIIAAMTRHPDGVPEQWENTAFGYEYLYSIADLVIPHTEQFGVVEAAVWEDIQSDMLLIGEVDERHDVRSFVSDDYLSCANDFDKFAVMEDAKAWMTDPANADYVRISD